jgi:hypothetical protein
VTGAIAIAWGALEYRNSGRHDALVKQVGDLRAEAAKLEDREKATKDVLWDYLSETETDKKKLLRRLSQDQRIISSFNLIDKGQFVAAMQQIAASGPGDESERAAYFASEVMHDRLDDPTLSPAERGEIEAAFEIGRNRFPSEWYFLPSPKKAPDNGSNSDPQPKPN